MLISPLARKLCAQKGIDPTTLRGSGPRGRIMAADVCTPTPKAAQRGVTAIADPMHKPCRINQDNYYAFDNEANMAALASISLPIAVQCEKLLENRYSLFDYIVRAVVKACCGHPSWQDADGCVNVLLFEGKGEKITAIENAAGKTIYTIARESRTAKELPASYAPHIIICDTSTAHEQVATCLHSLSRPAFAFVVRGKSPKVEIRAGNKELSSLVLPYTFYAAPSIPEDEAGRIAARLQRLLINPIRLLLTER